MWRPLGNNDMQKLAKVNMNEGGGGGGSGDGSISWTVTPYTNTCASMPNLRQNTYFFSHFGLTFHSHTAQYSTTGTRVRSQVRRNLLRQCSQLYRATHKPLHSRITCRYNSVFVVLNSKPFIL
jgi:hypothetical protein